MRALWTLLLMAALAAPSLAAPAPVDPARLMVLIVGPTSDPISPEEEDVVRRLNSLRRENALDQLQLGTMHWDQPAQAQLARTKLGIQRADLVAVALVELDARKVPYKTLYKVPRVTPESLDAAMEALRKWSRMTGLALDNVSPTVGGEPPPRQEAMTFEGILNTARRLESLSSTLWDRIRNEPLRSDGSDKAMRKALLGLAENSRLLRNALEQGRVNPTEYFQMTLASGDDFKRTEPQYTLPVAYRPSVPQIMEALAGIRQAYRQLNP